MFFRLTLFWIFGPIATLVVVACIGARHSSLAARFYEDTIRRQTGINTTIGRVEFVRPNAVKFHRFTIEDSSASRLTFDQLQIEEVTTKSREYRISAAAAVWNVPRGAVSQSAASPLDTVLAVSSSGLATPTQVNIGEVKIIRESPNTLPTTMRLTSFRAKSSRTEDEHQLDGTFTMANDAATDAVVWSANRAFKPSATVRSRVSLTTTPTSPIPMSLLSIFVPALDAAGSESRFVGTLRGELMWEEEQQRPLWSLFLQEATVRNIPLETLAKQFTNYRVSGTIEGIYLSEAHWRGGLVSATGWIHLVRGVLDTELIGRLATNLQLRTTPEDFLSHHVGGIVPFEQFGLRYQLTRRGATFEAPSENGIIMQDAARTMSLLIPPALQPTPYSEILAVLTPPTAPQVPWTPQTKQALQILPTEPATKRN
ncbi:MAG: hypothetical protein ACRC46_10785 [Thermoguttaceae bacterium]